MNYRPATVADADEIAAFIMMAMHDSCCRYFYGEAHRRADFHKMLSGLVRRTDTQYSYANAICAYDGLNRVVGLALSYDGGRLEELRQPFIDAVGETFGRDVSSMPKETGAGELYIDSLAVSEAHRHKGVASDLIGATIVKAVMDGHSRVGLLVDAANADAERLYTSLGFRLAGTNEFGGQPMRHLVREVGR